MKTLLLTVLIVAVFVVLALTAGWWVPALFSSVVADEAALQQLASMAQISCWLLATIAGALGVRRALDLDPAQKNRAARTKPAKSATAANGTKGALTGKAVRPGSADPEEGGDMVTLYTAGGVRIITEGSSLEIEASDAWLEQQVLDAVMVAEPEAVAVAAPSTAAPAPVITTPFNLPAGLPDFTGRKEEAAALIRRLSRVAQAPANGSGTLAANGSGTLAANGSGIAPIGTIAGMGGTLDDSRIAPIGTIAGMGGIGKTCLALYVAHNLANEGHFPDAQLYIDLKGTDRTPMESVTALKTLLSALLGPDPTRPEDEAGLSALWLSALQGKRTLLVLDNAATAAQVKPLLPTAQGARPSDVACAAIITSRRRFSIPGAGLLDLSRMKVEEARELLQRLAPRVDVAAADQIAELCGGLPLALRIAGNYLAVNDDISPQEYAANLSDERARLSQLRDPNNPDLDVASTLSLSVAQLDEGTRWAWRMLALLPGPFTPAAARALWGEGVTRDAWDPLDEATTLDWLRTLRNRSLVGYEAKTGRYHLHDLLQLAAGQELDMTQDGDGARARLAYYYLSHAWELDERQGYLDLDADWPQVQSALNHAATVAARLSAAESLDTTEAAPAGAAAGTLEASMPGGPQGTADADLMSDLVLAMNNYWSARGLVRERADWNQRAAQAAAAGGHHRREALHLSHLGVAQAERGDFRRAIETYQQALQIEKEIGDRKGEGACLSNLGEAYAAQGDAQRAAEFHQQALEIAQEVGDKASQSLSLGNLGRTHTDLGQPRQAIESLGQALALAQEIKDRRLEGTLLGHLGLAYAALGDTRQAAECQKQAITLHRQVGDRRGEAGALERLGRAYAEQGQPRRAIDYYEQALEISQAVGDRRSEGADLGYMGLAYAELGDNKRAIEFYDKALQYAQETGDRRHEANWLGHRGRALMELGNVRQAMNSYTQALRLAREIKDRAGEATWLGHIGQAHARLGEVSKAMEYQEQALAIYHEIGDLRSEGNYLASLGQLARLQGDADRAHEVWVSAMQTLESLKDPKAGQVWQWLAELEGQAA